MDEFDAIERLFKPLALGHDAALNLLDDIAYFPPEYFKNGFVITSDTLVEGTHFLSSDPISSIAKKLVRVNLSDIIAKGCKPIGVFLNLSWPKTRPVSQIEEFANSLGYDLHNLFGEIPLLGGDTTKIDGPLVLSLTILGEPINIKPVLRNNAQIGDILIVSGNIGDAKIGLEALQTNLNQFQEAISHYQIPKIQNSFLSEIIARYASSSIDVSDGLLGDANKIAQYSKVGIEIDLEKMPISNDAQNWLKNKDNKLDAILNLASFGDDYQSLFTINENVWFVVSNLAKENDIKLNIIGKCIKEIGLKINFNGDKIQNIKKLSYSHDL